MKYANVDTMVIATSQHWPGIHECVTSSTVSLMIPRRNFSFRVPHNLNKSQYKHHCLTRETARPLHTVTNQLVEHFSKKYEITQNFLNYRGDRLWAPPIEVTRHVIICTFGMLNLLRLLRGPPIEETLTSGGKNERSIPGTLAVGMCLILEF